MILDVSYTQITKNCYGLGSVPRDIKKIVLNSNRITISHDMSLHVLYYLIFMVLVTLFESPIQMLHSEVDYEVV